MPEADPCRRALTPTEEASLFARDALRAARHVMSGNPAGPEDTAYLAVYALLATAALGQGDGPEPADKGTHSARTLVEGGVGSSDTLGASSPTADFPAQPFRYGYRIALIACSPLKGRPRPVR